MMENEQISNVVNECIEVAEFDRTPEQGTIVELWKWIEAHVNSYVCTEAKNDGE